MGAVALGQKCCLKDDHVGTDKTLSRLVPVLLARTIKPTTETMYFPHDSSRKHIGRQCAIGSRRMDIRPNESEPYVEATCSAKATAPGVRVLFGIYVPGAQELPGASHCERIGLTLDSQSYRKVLDPP